MRRLYCDAVCSHREQEQCATCLYFSKTRSGGTAVEYGLVAVGISTAILAVVNSIGGTFNEKMIFISSEVRQLTWQNGPWKPPATAASPFRVQQSGGLRRNNRCAWVVRTTSDARTDTVGGTMAMNRHG